VVIRNLQVDVTDKKASLKESVELLSSFPFGPELAPIPPYERVAVSSV
jgi:hypothetical protein